jgi:Cu(I)/Ag(I) efflux system membrane fusion protein
MRKKWKLNSLLILGFLFFFISCNTVEEEKHFSTKTEDLAGLEQAANQTVFSDIKSIEPIEAKIVPIIKATGVITYDPSLINTISARYSGRIERLYVRFNFETVSEGQRIMDIYSPEILTEQQNLIFLVNHSSNEINLINSSRQKLRFYGLTEIQISQIVKLRQPINPLPVYSNYSGHIHDIGISAGQSNSSSAMGNGMTSKSSNSGTNSAQVQIENIPFSQTSSLSIKEGMYLERGQAIFAVYSTQKVWAVLNIFPEDAKFIKVGNKVSVASETNPSHFISAIINYIEPIAGQNASAIKARVYLQNEGGQYLKIGTLLTAAITSNEISGLWLQRKAVVNLGQKQIVFKKVKNYFKAQTISTGFLTDSLVQVVDGLTIGEKVAANAQYMVDSESFISTD